eukprot:232856_1
MTNPSASSTRSTSIALPAAEPDEICEFYQSVRQSQTLYELGVDEEGHPVEADKCCGCIPPIKKRAPDIAIDPRLIAAAQNNPALNRRQSMLQSKRQSMHQYKAKKDKFSQMYSTFVQDPNYKLISMMISISALFIRDLAYGLFPKTIDFYLLDIFLSVVFIWLMAELLLYSATHSNYCFTFFFWLDVVGTASILIDIPWIMVGIGLNNNIFLIVKGGRMGRAVRGAGSIRLMKVLKVLRMLRLFRIVQLFRKKKSKVGADGDETCDSPIEKHQSIVIDEDSQLKPTKMGALLSDRVTQKIILGVLISFLLLPLFDVGNMDQGEKTFITLEELEFVYSNHHNTTNGDILPSHAMDYDNSLDIFMQYHSDILYLGIASTTGDGFSQVEINEPNDDLRAEEQAEYATESGKSKTILNVRANVQEEAILNICLTTFIMGIFTVGAFVISVDAFMLVYPLEYLVIAIKRLSSIAVHQEKIIQNQNDNKNITISS